MAHVTARPLVLLRHAQGQWNLENRFTGWADVGIAQAGRAQARRAAALLHAHDYRFDRACSCITAWRHRPVGRRTLQGDGTQTLLWHHDTESILTIVFGLWLWLGYGFAGGWLHAKLALVVVLVLYHIYCAKLMIDFKYGRNRHDHVWYRWFNEFPTVILIAGVILAVVKPF